MSAPTRRPVGDAGHGKHTGKVGWMGGKHRRDGCMSAILVPVAALAALIAYVLL